MRVELAQPWLLVSKPLRQPFDDGSTVLVRGLVEHLARDRPLIYFGDPSHPLRASNSDQVLEAESMGHSPGMLAKARVLAQVVRPKHRRAPLHFFFTPNAITSRVLSTLRRLQPGRPMVQSLMSSHGAAERVRHLRCLDAVVVLSDATKTALVAAGLPAERIVRIHPAVAEAEAGPGDTRMALYAGDLDPATARRLIDIGHALTDPRLDGWTLVVACRPKGDADAEARENLCAELSGLIEAGRVKVLGRVEDMPALLHSADLQFFAADHVRRKVDLPLVILEGLARGVPVIAVDFAPLREIYDRAQEHGLEVGEAVPDQPQALARAWISCVSAGPQTLKQWRQGAQALARREFRLERMAKAHEHLYDTLARDDRYR